MQLRSVRVNFNTATYSLQIPICGNCKTMYHHHRHIQTWCCNWTPLVVVHLSWYRDQVTKIQPISFWAQHSGLVCGEPFWAQPGKNINHAKKATPTPTIYTLRHETNTIILPSFIITYHLHFYTRFLNLNHAPFLYGRTGEHRRISVIHGLHNSHSRNPQ